VVADPVSSKPPAKDWGGSDSTTRPSRPVQALFQCLQGHPSQADGWDVDLSGFGDGKLVARRKSPQPTAILRIALDP